MLLRLASPRSTHLTPLDPHGGAGIRACKAGSGTRQMQFYFNPDRRKLALDGVEQSGTAEYLRDRRGWSISATRDLELVRGPADGRRRFLDFLGSQIEPLYRANLRAYERALRSRNRLLKAVPVRRREVEAYDAPLLEAGAMLTQLRRSLVAELLPWVVRAQRNIRAAPAGDAEELALEYQPGAGDDFAAALADSRDEETRLRQTVVGPHRDDLLLTLDGRPAAAFGSEGQQRTLALALKLGAGRFARSGLEKAAAAAARRHLRRTRPGPPQRTARGAARACAAARHDHASGLALRRSRRSGLAVARPEACPGVRLISSVGRLPHAGLHPEAACWTLLEFSRRTFSVRHVIDLPRRYPRRMSPFAVRVESVSKHYHIWNSPSARLQYSVPQPGAPHSPVRAAPRKPAL